MDDARVMSAIDYAKAAIDTMMRKYEASKLPPEGHFHYHQGVFLSGVYQTYLLTGDEKYFEYMKAWVDAMMDEEGSFYQRGECHLDDIQPGNLIFPIYERYPLVKYRKALDNLMADIHRYPRNQEGGFWHMKLFPNQMWLDGLYMGGPFVCKYAKLSEHAEYYDISIEQALLMERKTLDRKTGLWYHAYDETRTAEWADKVSGCSPEFWGRSLGWVPVAILEELEYIPQTHPEYQEMKRLVKDLLTAICRYQSEDGRWYQVVNKGDEPENWLENSCSCLYVAAIAKAVKMGILDDTYWQQAQKGYEGVINSLTWDGDDLQIGNVCIGTGVGDFAYYCERPTSTNDLHGVGAFLLMCAAVEEKRKKSSN